MAIKKLLPLPAVIDPPDTIFVCVAIPDEEGHRAAFLGAILTLTRWVAWERDAAHTGQAVAEVWKPIFECILEQMG